MAFRDAWAVGNDLEPSEAITAGLVDARLNAERVGPGRSKLTFRGDIDDLPDGVFVTLVGDPGVAHLVLGDELLAWAPGGYTGRRPRPIGEDVSILTPRSTVGAIRSGNQPEVHPSAIGA